jgi:hypothetical protein
MTKQPADLLAIYDVGPDADTIDRYTFVLWGETRPNPKPPYGRLYQCLGTDESGNAVSMFGECEVGPHLGKRVKWGDVPERLQQHVAWRLEAEDEI